MQDTVKSVIGLAIGFAIGGACRAFGVPLPAPPVLIGAGVVARIVSGPHDGQPIGPSPADAIRRWPTEVGHPIQDLATKDGLTLLPG